MSAGLWIDANATTATVLMPSRLRARRLGTAAVASAVEVASRLNVSSFPYIAASRGCPGIGFARLAARARNTAVACERARLNGSS